MDEDNYQRLRDYALKLLSFRPRSTDEISIKLKQYCLKRKFPNKLVGQLVEEFTQLKLLDDKVFIRWWVGQRQSYKPKGIKAIKSELLQKGIAREAIDEVLSEDKERNATEYDLALKVINKKLNYLKHLSPDKMKIKIRDFLIRRGFDWDIVYKVIDSVIEKE